MERLRTEHERTLLIALYSASGAFDSRKLSLDVDFPEGAVTPRGTILRHDISGTPFDHVCCCHITGSEVAYEVAAQIFQRKGRTLYPIQDLNELVNISANRLYFRLLAHNPAKPDVKFELGQFQVDEIEEESNRIFLHTTLSPDDLLE